MEQQHRYAIRRSDRQTVDARDPELTASPSALVRRDLGPLECIGCGSDVIYCRGEIVTTPYFRHVSAECDPWWEPEGPWHQGWKALVRPDAREVTFGGGEHRADIYDAQSRRVIELQHSPISSAEIAERETYYRNMVWLFDAERFRDRLTVATTGHYFHSVRHHRVAWKHAHRTILSSQKPLFFDFGDRILRLVRRDEVLWGRWHSREEWTSRFLHRLLMEPVAPPRRIRVVQAIRSIRASVRARETSLRRSIVTLAALLERQKPWLPKRVLTRDGSAVISWHFLGDRALRIAERVPLAEALIALHARIDRVQLMGELASRIDPWLPPRGSLEWIIEHWEDGCKSLRRFEFALKRLELFPIPDVEACARNASKAAAMMRLVERLGTLTREVRVMEDEMVNLHHEEIVTEQALRVAGEDLLLCL